MFSLYFHSTDLRLPVLWCAVLQQTNVGGPPAVLLQQEAGGLCEPGGPPAAATTAGDRTADLSYSRHRPRIW